MTRRSLVIVAAIELVASVVGAWVLLAAGARTWQLATGPLLVQLTVLAVLGVTAGAAAKIATRWRTVVELVRSWHRAGRERIELSWPAR